MSRPVKIGPGVYTYKGRTIRKRICTGPGARGAIVRHAYFDTPGIVARGSRLADVVAMIDETDAKEQTR